jgi:chemotaxis protein MotA
VFEGAGGYSSTVGIIGAVMILIQVMKNLANIEEVGHGIAVAFVATGYGVVIANLLLLPADSKIKPRIESATELKQLKLEGVVAIVEGLSPSDSQQAASLPAQGEERSQGQGQSGGQGPGYRTAAGRCQELTSMGE